MALTDRQYYQIYRSSKEDLVTLITESSGEISRVTKNSSTLDPTDKILIDAPGSGKQIILFSATASLSMSLGIGSKGTNSLTYVEPGGLSWPAGLAAGENNYVSTNAGGGNYIAITYTIVDV